MTLVPVCTFIYSPPDDEPLMNPEQGSKLVVVAHEVLFSYLVYVYRAVGPCTGP